MRFFLTDKTDRRGDAPTWSPLLVLGLSVMASVVLISACMAMIAPDGGGDAQPIRRANAAAAPV